MHHTLHSCTDKYMAPCTNVYAMLIVCVSATRSMQGTTYAHTFCVTAGDEAEAPADAPMDVELGVGVQFEDEEEEEGGSDEGDVVVDEDEDDEEEGGCGCVCLAGCCCAWFGVCRMSLCARGDGCWLVRPGGWVKGLLGGSLGPAWRESGMPWLEDFPGTCGMHPHTGCAKPCACHLVAWLCPLELQHRLTLDSSGFRWVPV